jgi:rhodanese-related sulfurtransferase
MASSTEVDQQQTQDLVLRAMEYRESFGEAAVILDGLVRRLGLFPYLDLETLPLSDSIAYEFHRPLNMKQAGIVFHRVQGDVYRRLLDGENVILSAPTSFGKSLVIDALIASEKYQNIAIVVPTIALIDETRRRLAERFSGQFKIITHPSQKRVERNVFVMTQERLMEVEPLKPLDLFIVDEFYKLQPRQEDTERSLVLNMAFDKLRKTGAQFYLLGPNIQNIVSLPPEIVFSFIKTDYKTVASEVTRVKPKGKGFDELVDLCRGMKEPTLVYCQSPRRVRDVAAALLEAGITSDEPKLQSAYKWIGDEYHEQWLFARSLQRQIGMHHGRLPRTLAQFVVKAFNDGLLRFLVCTSTLIEGVNTKAKNVIVFDNKVAKSKFDYFTYNNILGRSGRMFQHFVGRLYIFHEPPAEELPLVDIPVLTQPDDTPDSLLMQISEEDLLPASRAKISDILNHPDIPGDVLRASKGVDPRAQIRLAQEIRSQAALYHPLLNWTRTPSWDQLVAVCEIIWRFFVPTNQRRASVSSGRQLAFRIDNFRRQGSVRALIRDAISKAGEETNADDTVEDTIEFLRYWANVNFPKWLTCVDRVQNHVFTSLRRRPGNYAFYAGYIENWMLDPAIMALDEYGVPVQVGQKLQSRLQPGGDLDQVLDRLKRLKVSELGLSEFEARLLADAQSHL